MKILDYNNPDLFSILGEAAAPKSSTADVAKIAASVIDDVRKYGDKAVEDLTLKFDGVNISAEKAHFVN